jgi:hypothetical protein
VNLEAVAGTITRVSEPGAGLAPEIEVPIPLRCSARVVAVDALMLKRRTL